MELVKSYKQFRVVAAVGEDTLDFLASDALFVQSVLPAQLAKIDVSDTESVTTLVKRLIGIGNHCDVGFSKDKTSFLLML